MSLCKQRRKTYVEKLSRKARTGVLTKMCTRHSAVKLRKPQVMHLSADVFNWSKSSAEMFSSDYTITHVAGSELNSFLIQIG